MGTYKKLNHSIYECKYHLVWIPKYRFKVMEGRIRYYVREKVRQLCDWKKFEIIQGNVQPEHIHLVFWIPPTWAVCKAIGYLKGKSALGIFERFPDLKRRYWNKKYWSPGYCVSTVGLNEQQIRDYVKWQQKRDREMEESSQLNLFES